ncbi:hypothetical protein INT43_003962, partial [Umbelopsis isabellina]
YYQSKNSINSTIFATEIPLDTNIPIQECSIPEVQALVSSAMAAIRILTSIAVLVMAGWFGEESDYRGRLFVLRVAPVGMMLSTVLMIVVALYQEYVGIWLIFLAPIIKGIFAGEHIVFSAFQAYISDATTPQNRTLYMSFMMATLYSGLAVGPIAGSWLIKATGDIMSVFYANVTVEFLFFLYVLFLVPESNFYVGTHPNKKRKTFVQRLNIFSALNIIVRTRPQHATRYALWYMTSIMFMTTMIMLPPTLLYAMLRFGWTAYEGGFYMSMQSFTKLMALVVVLPIITRIFKRKNQPHRKDILFDAWMMRIGYAVDAIGLIMMATAPDVPTFYGAGAVQALSMVAQPSTKSLLTVLVKPNEVGELFGAITVVDAVAGIISQFFVNALYAATVKTMPNVVFYACAGIAAGACLAACFVHPKSDNDDGLVPVDIPDVMDAETSNSA